MVAFETLLLGIITGLGPVRLMVAPPVASVELRLDTAAVGVLHGPPWAMECDFGTGPMPHELTAVGRDAAGREVARATQWVNLGRERVKLSAILERDAATRRPSAVHLEWETIEMVQPQAVTATLDGAPLAVTDGHRIALPKVELTQPHLVSVEVFFSPQLRDRADIAFGGDVIDQTESDLTAVAVALAPSQDSLALRDVQGLFSARGRALTPIGVDEGHAEVALVVDQSVSAVVAVHPKDWANRSGGAWDGSFGHVAGGPERPPLLETIGADTDRFYFVSTSPSSIFDAGRQRTYFKVSPPMKLSGLSRYPVVSWLGFFQFPASPQQTISDAVAVAASEIAASNHRRALVLVLAEPPAGPGTNPADSDASTYGVAAVKAYLAALDVPLVVWSLTGRNPGSLTAVWGPAVAVGDRWEMQAQAKRLEKALASQRIVWFSGHDLPQSITLDESKTALRLAR